MVQSSCTVGMKDQSRCSTRIQGSTTMLLPSNLKLCSYTPNIDILVLVCLLALKMPPIQSKILFIWPLKRLWWISWSLLNLLKPVCARIVRLLLLGDPMVGCWRLGSEWNIRLSWIWLMQHQLLSITTETVKISILASSIALSPKIIGCTHRIAKILFGKLLDDCLLGPKVHQLLSPLFPTILISANL